MSLPLDRDMEDAHRDLLTMCGLTEELVTAAVAAVGIPVAGKSAAGPEVAARLKKADRRIDFYDLQIEERCLRVLARHAPVAEDLRRVICVLKIGRELERVADLGVHIGERADADAAAAGGPHIAGLAALPRVRQEARVATEMLRAAIDAFVAADADAARGVCADDDLVDGLNRQTIEEMQHVMRSDPAAVTAAVNLFGVSRNVERIADHATNIAKEVIYLVEGRLVRHAKKFPGRRTGETAEEHLGPAAAAAELLTAGV